MHGGGGRVACACCGVRCWHIRSHMPACVQGLIGDKIRSCRQVHVYRPVVCRGAGGSLPGAPPIPALSLSPPSASVRLRGRRLTRLHDALLYARCTRPCLQQRLQAMDEASGRLGDAKDGKAKKKKPKMGMLESFKFLVQQKYLGSALHLFVTCRSQGVARAMPPGIMPVRRRWAG